MTRNQYTLLEWLAREDASYYRECHGADLDFLHSMGYVHCTGDTTGSIWPPPSGQHGVSVTPLGHKYLD
jgi:hypothetical protein